MAGRWDEVARSSLVVALGGPEAAPDVADTACDVLVSQPVTRDYLRVATTFPEMPEGTIGYLVPRTQIFVNLGRAKDLRGDVYATAAVYVATHSVTLAAAIGLFRRFVQAVKLLDEDELDLVKVVLALTADENAVATLDQVLACYDGQAPKLPERLAALVERGVLLRDSGGWVVAP